jgi:GNAT superfamily N-acetyltransferase
MRSETPSVQPLGTHDDAQLEVAKPGEVDAFWQASDRDWRSELWRFRVVWHEQSHDIVIRAGDEIVGALRLRIAASLAHVEALYVLSAWRKRGLARAIVTRGEELANYYNCHKMCVAVFAGGPAEQFFTRCGYTVEAVLAQHTFKLDVALLRKFLL